MVIALRRVLILVLLALTLLIGLLAGSANRLLSPTLLHHTSIRSHQAVAWYCPPPPRYC